MCLHFCKSDMMCFKMIPHLLGSDNAKNLVCGLKQLRPNYFRPQALANVLALKNKEKAEAIC